eukprot:scaffold4577_cov135-Isochrysis_galbana.AAC.5
MSDSCACHFVTVWHASGRAVRASERDTRPCHRGPEIFTRPGKPHDFCVVPHCGTWGPRGDYHYR